MLIDEYKFEDELKVLQEEAKSEGILEEKRSNAREMLIEGIPKSTIERIVKMTFSELGLNDDGTPKES